MNSGSSSASVSRSRYLCVLPLDNNNAVFNLCCRLCSAYERKAFLAGLQYGAELMLELGKESDR